VWAVTGLPAAKAAKLALHSHWQRVLGQAATAAAAVQAAECSVVEKWEGGMSAGGLVVELVWQQLVAVAA
jgi:hypothetical protein